jgi:hypothetical protein
VRSRRIAGLPLPATEQEEIKIKRHVRVLSIFVAAMAVLILSTAATEARAKKETLSFAIAKVYFEYNSSASERGDLGVQNVERSCYHEITTV